MPLTVKAKPKSKLSSPGVVVGAIHPPSWMTVDPGLGGTGWALWSGAEPKTVIGRVQYPLSSGAITTDLPHDSWIRRVDDIAYQLMRVMYFHNPVKRLYVEQPEFFEGGKGMTAARRGDLVKLVTTFGAILGRCAQFSQSPFDLDGHTCNFIPVEIIKWKGNLDKAVCNERVAKRLPDFKPKRIVSTHEWDAIGIGLYLTGNFS